MEMRAINWVRVPALAIFVLLLVILSANSLMPLVHLHNSFKSVGVLHRHTEFIVDNFSLIYSLSLKVNKFEVVCWVSCFSLYGNYLLLGTVHALSKSDNLFLVFPEENDREWNQD